MNVDMLGRLLRRVAWNVGLAAVVGIATLAAAQPGHNLTIVASRELRIGGGTVQADFAEGLMDLSQDAIFAHVQAAASAINTYYGRFPVSRARVLIAPVADRGGIVQGTTWGDMAGWPGMTRFRIGQHATADDLKDDWMMTHELDHMAFPSLPDDQHWMEEGLATYVEPIARVQSGELKPQEIWRDMVRDMHKGEPAEGDQGLDHTHSWGRTYWGGAMFCLVADVEIRRQTGNQRGLQDALRAIVAAGGTIDHEWPLDKALAIGDKATGTHVLSEQYAKWKDSAVTVDLDKLWTELGIQRNGDAIEFVATAPLANVREAIARPSR
ncbi:hypothetical protein P8935_00180 [Telmatobacter sp. DSM 110680]|uniref:Peptidase M61 catalytic domain-containing protein n=1 Tax=Telmatobacter sp. DSM 110680 TaxID=3036704 RepID=A0AAU7DL14_9BACT